MTERVTRADWQQLAADLLEHYRGILAQHGIIPGPDLHLAADESTPYSYCDLTAGRISLNLPGTDRFGDLLLIMAVGGLVGTPSPAETVRFMRAMLPYLLGHELAHYLRHRYGAFAANRWVEEHAANRVGLALAAAVPAFAAELPYLRGLAQAAHARLPLRDDQVAGALRDTHGATVAEVQAFVRLTGADELEALRAAGLEAEVLALSDRQARAATAFNESYLTDAMAYMRQQLAWFCQQVLEPDPPGLGAALEAHILTPSWEERLQAESAAVLAQLAEAGAPAEPPHSRAELLALGAGADDRLRALALEQLRLAGDTAGLMTLLEQAVAACRHYAALQASAMQHDAPTAVRAALADAHHLALEAGAEAAATLAGVPLHVVRAGLNSHAARAGALTLGLVKRRLAGDARALVRSLLHPEPTVVPDFRQALLADPDPLVAAAAGAEGRLDAETATELPFFRGCHLLRPLLGKELLPLAAAAREVRAKPGAILDRRGAPPARIFLMADGRLIGLAEALAGAPMQRALRMPALGHILGIDVPAFLTICRAEPKLSRTIAGHLAWRVYHRALPLLPAAGSVAPVPDRPLLPAEKALALLETDLFGGQGSKALLGIAESFVTRFYPAGAPVAVAGGAPRLVAVVAGQVQSGAVRLEAGGVLGDTECLLGRPWREGAVAGSATVTLEAERDDFLRLLYMLPDLPFRLARRMARRVAATELARG
ncbi:MAG TPA: hypothetical protein VD902_10030 [Symbiobacteriaceae bacterium]|nr:hypothetical protein [Symbiobacteriaceae bacterium]